MSGCGAVQSGFWVAALEKPPTSAMAVSPTRMAVHLWPTTNPCTSVAVALSCRVARPLIVCAGVSIRTTGGLTARLTVKLTSAYADAVVPSVSETVTVPRIVTGSVSTGAIRLLIA